MARRNRPTGNWAAASGGRGWKYRRFSGTRLTAAQRRLIGTFSVLAVGLLLGYFVWLVLFGKTSEFQFVAVGISSYDDASSYDDDLLPPSPGVDCDLDAVRQLVVRYPSKIFDWNNRANQGGLQQKLSNLNMHGGTLLFYLSSLAMTDDNGPHLKLLMHSDHLDGGVAFAELLDLLKRSGAERVVLLLDLNRIPPDSRLGIFSHRIPEYVKMELEDYANRGSTDWLDVVCSRGNHQESVLNGQSPARISIFIEQIIRALEGAADGESGPKDLRIQYCEFRSFIKRTVSERAKELAAVDQQVEWISHRGDDPDDQFVITALKPPQLLPKQTAPAAEEKQQTPEVTEEKAAEPIQEIAADAPNEITPKDTVQPSGPTAVVESTPQTLSSVWRKKDNLLHKLFNTAEISPELLLEESRVLEVSRLLWDLKRAAEFDAAELKELTRQNVDETHKPFMLLDQLFTQKTPLPRQGGGPQSWLQLPVIEITAEQRQNFLAVLTAEATSAPQAPEFVEFLSEHVAAQKGAGGGQKESELLAALTKRAQQASESYPETLPFEVRFLASVAPTVLSESNGRRCVVRIAWLHRELREFLRNHPRRLSQDESQLSACFRSLECAERWIAGAALAGLPEAERALKTAEASFLEAKNRITEIDDACRTALRTWIELPFWIRLAAVDSEESSGELVNLTPLVEQINKDASYSLPPGAWNVNAKVQRTVSELIELALELAPLIDGQPAGPTDSNSLIQKAAEAKSKLIDLNDHKFGDLSIHHLLSLSQPSLADRRRMEAWSTCPLLSDEDRLKIQKRLGQGGKSTLRAPRMDDRGLWQGYWSIQLLRLGSRDSQLQSLWSEWIYWCRAVKEKKSDRELATKDAKLGKLVRAQWKNVEQSLRANLVAPLDQRLNSKPERAPAISQSEPPLLAEVRRRSRHPLTSEDRNYYRKLLTVLSADVQPEESRFDMTTENLVMDGNLKGELRVSVVHPGDLEDGPSRFWWHAPELKIEDRVRFKSSDIELPNGQVVPVQFTAKEKSAALHPSIIVAAMTSDRFPYVFRQVPVARATEDAAWQIRFVRGDSQREIYQERQPTGDTTLVYLPPQWPPPGASPGDEGLLCQLVRPPTDQDQEFGVRIFRRVAPGSEWRPISDRKLKVPAGKEPVTIPFTDVAPSATPAPDPKKPAAEIDVTHGLKFELTLNDGKQINRMLLPAYWSETAYLKEPTLELTQERLRVTVTRHEKPRDEQRECFWPNQIAVQLQVPRNMLQVGKNMNLGGEEATLLKGKTQVLGLELPPGNRQRFEHRAFEISLIVAGIPHAWTWRREWGVNVARQNPEPRFAELAFGQVWSRSEKQPLEIPLHLNEPNLRQRIGTNDDWQLHCEWQTDDNSENWSSFKDFPKKLTGCYERTVLFQPAPDGRLQFQVKTRDFMASAPMHQLNSRIRVRSWLTRNDQQRGAAAEQRLAVTDGRPPVVGWESSPTEFEVRDGGKPLILHVFHSDPVAGIGDVRLGIDKDLNGKFDPDTELLTAPLRFEIFDDETQEWHKNERSEWKISPQDLLELPLDKDYRLFCVATNGAGKVSEPSQVKIRLKSPPKKPQPNANPTGKIRVVFRHGGRKTVKLTGPKPKTVTFERDAHEWVSESLPVGEYKIKITYKSSATKDVVEEGDVTVEDGKTVLAEPR